MDRRGYPPSIREMGDAVGLASSSSVAHQLKMLEARDSCVGTRTVRVRWRCCCPQRNVQLPNQLAASRQPGVGDDTGGDAFPEPVHDQCWDALPQADRSWRRKVSKMFRAAATADRRGHDVLARVRSDSMIEAAICDGDWVVVRQRPTANNGDIVAALLDNEATVKTFKRTGSQVWLKPHNPAYDPIDGNHATILGKVVAVLRRI